MTGWSLPRMLAAMPILAGRVTALDRAARTVALGSTTFTLAPGISIYGLDIGSHVSIVYEEVDGARVAIQLLRLPY